MNEDNQFENQVQPLRRKKWLVRGLIIFFVLAIALYMAGNLFLNRATQLAMLQLVVEASHHGVAITQPSFASAHLQGILGATWTGLQAKLQREKKKAKKAGLVWETKVDHLTVDWNFHGQASLDVQGMTFTRVKEPLNESESSEKRIELEHVRCVFPFALFDAKADIKVLFKKFLHLWQEGEIDLPLAIHGKIVFHLKKQSTELRIQTLEQAGETTIVFLREDVARLSDVFEDKLTEAEIDLIATNVQRAPQLLKIKNDAETISADARQKNDAVPQDAYRHVLWSYLLTQKYGAKLAKEVGDAHEMGDTGNSDAEREMDLHNNAIGRKYARDSISTAEVLERLMSDPEVKTKP